MLIRKLLCAFLLASLGLAFAAPAAAASQPIHIYYAGPAGSLETALSLAKNFMRVDDPSQAQVLVLNDRLPGSSTLAAIAAQVRQGAGLVLFLGPTLAPLEVSDLLGVPVGLEVADTPLSLVAAAGIDDPLQQDIIWNSAPQVRERLTLSSPSSALTPLVLGYEDHNLVLGKLEAGAGRAYVFTAFIDGANPQFQDWAYYNYLVYHLVTSAAGQTPLSFADYPASPVPHGAERALLFGGLGFMLLLFGVIFGLVRRYSRAHPELLEALVADQQQFAAREAGTRWEEIGFHRPLGGFLLAFMLGLLLFIPLIIYQNLLLPSYILPSAQALGIWGRVTQFFALTWQFFDMGTSIAFIKYLSEYRVHDPRRGLQYGQVFIWWQAISGAIQVTLVIALASTLAPRSAYALYTWSVIIHALIQIPGFYMVFRHALTGFQRFDYAQILDVAQAVILPMLVQPVIVTLMFAWGRTHPVFGDSMGGLLGMGLAAYAAEILTFLVGWWLYRRLGYNARLLFLAHFDWETLKTSLRFGVFEMLGSIAWAGGQAAEVWITQARLINYAEIWGNWGLAQNFIFAYNVIATLFNNLMPAISEAISHGRKVLSQYYTVMAYKWGGMISAFLGAVLLAVADRFILGASGPEFVRAAGYAIPLAVWGAIQYPSWVGDAVQLAANRPYLKSLLVTGEQIMRVILALLLLQSLQINALILAYFIGLLSKDIIAYFVNHRLCFPQRFYPWQSLAAPLLAGAVHYALLRWLTGLIWQQDQITSIIIFFIGVLPSLPVYAFLYGLAGGWDDATLEELRRAVELSNFMRPLAWIFWAATYLGARLSPLHNRFPITIRQAALEEARALNAEKVNLLEGV